MNTLLFIYQGTLWFLSGFLTGLTAFGGNLVAIPLLTLAIPARDAILLGCLCGSVVVIALGLLYRRWALWNEVLILGPASLLGVPLGLAFLQHSGPRVLLLAAGGCLTLFLLWQFLSMRLDAAEKPISRWWGLPLGMASGITFAAVGMGGPPLVLYAYLRQWGKENSIGGINLTTAITLVALLPAQWGAGLYTWPLLKDALVGAVFCLVGILVSLPLARKINALLFRRFLLVMIGLSAVMLLARGLLA